MKTLLWILLVLLFLLAAFSAFLGWKMIDLVMKANRKTFEILRVQDAGFAQGFADYETVWERHAFVLPVEGAEISGEYIVNPKPEGKVNKVAIICHGHTVMRAADIKYARMFYQLGYHAIIFDERYFGGSTGKYCTLGMNESKDIAALIRYARTVFGEDCFLALHGESMGAASELLSLQYETPDLVIADCPFASTTWQFRDVAKKKVGIFRAPAMFFGRWIGVLRAGYDYTKVNPIDAVRGTKVPICFIHGLSDTYISCEHSKKMYELCENPFSELHLVPGAEHALSVAVDKDGYEETVKKFVRKVEESSAKVQV